jgi:hypothetical protein
MTLGLDARASQSKRLARHQHEAFGQPTGTRGAADEDSEPG